MKIGLVLKVFRHNDYFDHYINNVKGDNSIDNWSIILKFATDVRFRLSNIFASLAHIEIQIVMELLSYRENYWRPS